IINEKFGAVACEMEGGSIGQVCYVNKVPFAVLRSISDSMSEEDDAVEYSVFSKSAAEKAINIITALVSDEN
ncbi:MAG: 5'-methylthioadenosine/adenosylhomocysteine nucleosidase, partial [Clostridia bacterium]|nr:5'-methylthioadenosine/adenosylhomocysteine nucleosidase [Clostridia bacterium]